MNKRILSIILSMALIFTTFVPITNAETVTMYASDGRTSEVDSTEVSEWKKVGWFETADDAKIITMYASDGRTISIPQLYREDYLNVGWFDTADDAKLITMYASDGRMISVFQKDRDAYFKVGWFDSAEDAEIITMYASDGRTISIPQLYREDYLNVGWFNTADDAKMITMYSMDGRTISIVQRDKDAYLEVGWYSDISDVTVKMYDADGNERTVYKDHVQKELANGLSLDNSSNTQLMFSSDGRFITVPKKDVEAYKNVGWYAAGSDKVDPSRPMVAITYDDGPGKHTDRILSVLEKYNARATFFVVGQNVSGYKETLNRAISLGCEIGNHTWSHVNLTSTIGSQLSSTNEAIYNATGVYPKIYRPPYGSYNSYVLNSISMPAIMWSVDTLDWKTRSASSTLASVQRDTRDGGIILMHDIHSPTADAAESVVKWLLMQGYQLVTVSELLDARAGGAVNGKVYTKAQ